ncbi:ABC transporter substrate-binding protein [Paenibacillus sp. GYB003]|uniref:ABC transporter substrate-binding protein n=1 Tax=Paenibacillus sp. GYB003 TaxID=2994392 RepID=UPI002F968FFD
MKKTKWVVALSVMAALSLAGCSSKQPASGGGGKETEYTVPTDPVTLKFYVNVTRLSELEYQTIYVEPLKKKYPHITLQKLEGDLAQLVAAGEIPDLIMSDNDWHMPLKQLDLPADLTELVVKTKFDLNAFRPETVQAIRNLDPKGGLEGIPFDLNTGALFYNKDLFDKFGVAYPKDDMLWQDILELSKKLTRQEDGVQYIGWDPRFPDHLVSPYSQEFVDPKTNKALVDIPLYRKVLDLFQQVYQQPGYIGPKNEYTYGPDGFTKTHKLAMQADWVGKLISDLLQAEASGIKMNWDMVSEPRFQDAVGKGRHALADMLVITKASKHKEQAMQVIQMITSRDHQIMLTRTGRLTALNDPEVINQFGANFPSLQGKNLRAVYKNPPVATPKPHPADKEVQTIIRAIRKEMAIGKKDINTVLREGQEKADKKIAEMAAQ